MGTALRRGVMACVCQWTGKKKALCWSESCVSLLSYSVDTVHLGTFQLKIHIASKQCFILLLTFRGRNHKLLLLQNWDQRDCIVLKNVWIPRSNYLIQQCIAKYPFSPSFHPHIDFTVLQLLSVFLQNSKAAVCFDHCALWTRILNNEYSSCSPQLEQSDLGISVILKAG